MPHHQTKIFSGMAKNKRVLSLHQRGFPTLIKSNLKATPTKMKNAQKALSAMYHILF